jgi:hypothetical protein
MIYNYSLNTFCILKKTGKLFLILCLMLVATSFGQSASTYCFTASSEIYTPLTGTTYVSGLVATQDDGFSNLFPLDSSTPFNFVFLGVSYSQAQASSKSVLSFLTSKINEPNYNGHTNTAYNGRKRT